ncbi:hypothetical protein NDN08_000811 [Rhodosorus marinus]|uniref:SAP domain-containing protein n=1 Tax=Rhodosorus marinus TaxID=101924 RepID=A0AAV8URU8_9RHOD|nr:hypothetical protein NDN08_000811 [Rhodosorus marinus]
MKVDELRKELEARGLDTAGLKAVLLKRLKEAIAAEGQPDPSEEVAPQTSDGQDAEADVKSEEEAKQQTETKELETDMGKTDEEKQPDAADAGSNAEATTQESDFEAARRRRAERFGVPYEPIKASAKPSHPEKPQPQIIEKKPAAAPVVSEEELEKRRMRALKFGLGEKSAKESLQEEGLLQSKRVKRAPLDTGDESAKKAKTED